MTSPDPDHEQQWEDLVRRLGGSPEEARAKPAQEPIQSVSPQQPAVPGQGPRDYSVADEIVEDFQPPQPRPMLAGSPRVVLSWLGILGALVIWIAAALLSWMLPWWITVLTVVSFLGGAISLFFLLPKSWAHRDPYDDDDYGHGAKL